ncbi:MAG TPA: alpha/beta fold hydrolase [Herpetosiphonaceae bacterium]|nr:alpha/beta fold hydrolase [Herpetosiphonaceae bacterium]
MGGIRTRFVVCGDGPPVVLIHGLGASFWNWWRNLPELARHFRVVAFDLFTPRRRAPANWSDCLISSASGMRL